MSVEKFGKESEEWKMFQDFSEILKIVKKYDNSDLKFMFKGLVNTCFVNGDKTKEQLVDFWKFTKKNWEIKNNDDYWNELIKQAGSVSEKHKNNEFISELLAVFMLEQERKNKNG